MEVCLVENLKNKARKLSFFQVLITSSVLCFSFDAFSMPLEDCKFLIQQKSIFQEYEENCKKGNGLSQKIDNYIKKSNCSSFFETGQKGIEKTVSKMRVLIKTDFKKGKKRKCAQIGVDYSKFSKHMKEISEKNISANNFENILNMTPLVGKFSEVIIANKKVKNSELKNFIMNRVYKHGSSFSLSMEDGTVLSFYHRGGEEEKIDKDTRKQTVEYIYITRNSEKNVKGAQKIHLLGKDFYKKSKRMEATGSCTYRNPFKGTRDEYLCEAKSKQKLYRFKFIHNGDKPEVIHFK